MLNSVSSHSPYFKAQITVNSSYMQQEKTFSTSIDEQRLIKRVINSMVDENIPVAQKLKMLQSKTIIEGMTAAHMEPRQNIDAKRAKEFCSLISALACMHNVPVLIPVKGKEQIFMNPKECIYEYNGDADIIYRDQGGKNGCNSIDIKFDPDFSTVD